MKFENTLFLIVLKSKRPIYFLKYKSEDVIFKLIGSLILEIQNEAHGHKNYS